MNKALLTHKVWQRFAKFIKVFQIFEGVAATAVLMINWTVLTEVSGK